MNKNLGTIYKELHILNYEELNELLDTIKKMVASHEKILKELE